MKKGSIFIVSAPSGAGKTTLCRKLTGIVADIVHSVSYTTRGARTGETDGKDYIFVDKRTFMEMVEQGEFLEWAEVHGNLYGTSRIRLQETVNKGTDVILDIDIQGAGQTRERNIDATYIFILPPSIETLVSRLTSRKTESEVVIQKRMKKALEEIRNYKSYDYVIINNDFDSAVDELRSIVLSKRVQIHQTDHQWVEERFSLTDS